MKRRKDPKGNLLKEREGYVEEKSGEIRYRYRYQDKETRKKVCIYAKSLSKLREKVKEYQEELEKGVIKGSEENKILLNEAFARGFKNKTFSWIVLNRIIWGFGKIWLRIVWECVLWEILDSQKSRHYMPDCLKKVTLIV